MTTSPDSPGRNCGADCLWYIGRGGRHHARGMNVRGLNTAAALYELFGGHRRIYAAGRFKKMRWRHDDHYSLRQYFIA